MSRFDPAVKKYANSSIDDLEFLFHHCRCVDHDIYQNIKFRDPIYYWRWKGGKHAYNNILSHINNQFSKMQGNSLIELVILAYKFEMILPDADEVIGVFVNSENTESACEALLLDLVILSNGLHLWYRVVEIFEKFQLKIKTPWIVVYLSDFYVHACYMLGVSLNRVSETAKDYFVSKLRLVEEMPGVDASRLDVYSLFVSLFERNISAVLDRSSNVFIDPMKLIPSFRPIRHFISKSMFLDIIHEAEIANSDQLFLNTEEDNVTGSKERVCILVSCDQVYFRNYADNFLKSVSLISKELIVHFHCLNFQPSSDFINRCEIEHELTIKWSYEKVPNYVPEKYFRDYCTIARYIFLPKYLQAYSVVIISDIDGVVDFDFVHIQKNEHILLYGPLFDKGALQLPWNLIHAGRCVFNNDKRGQFYARRLSAYLLWRLRYCIENNHSLFYADQAALLMMYEYSEEKSCFKQGPKLFYQSHDSRGNKGNLRIDFQKEFLSKLEMGNISN